MAEEKIHRESEQVKLIDRINLSNKVLFSFELLPPLKGHNLEGIYKAIDALLDFNPVAINITYHQDEVVYRKLENGLLQPYTVNKRPGTVAICAAIRMRYPHVSVIPHLICGGTSREETEYDLIDLNFLGIKNILALRGDPLKTQRNFTPDVNGNANATELVQQIVNLNNKIMIDGEIARDKTDFCIGVAGYPEKHSEAPNMDTDLRRLKEKVDAGADYIVTQMFFDNSKFFNFVEKCRAIGITVPIIPGLKPLATLNDGKVLPKIFNIDIPEPLVTELEKCKNNKDVTQVGAEWTIHQSKELIAFGVPVLHYYTYGISEGMLKIASEIF